MNNPYIQLQLEKYLQAERHINTATKNTQATPDENQSNHTTTTTMKETHNDPTPYKY